MQNKQPTLSASLGDYLKVIHRLSKDRGTVHAIDISKALNVSKPSVTGALRLLAARGMVTYEPYSPILLTARGRAIAEDLSSRFIVLRDFLVNVLKIETAEAEEAACLAEHVFSPRVMERLSAFLEYVQHHPGEASNEEGSSYGRQS